MGRPRVSMPVAVGVLSRRKYFREADGGWKNGGAGDACMMEMAMNQR